MQFAGKIGQLLILAGVTTASGLGAGTAIGIVWSRSEVIPVVLVKPGVGGFVPTEGTSIGNTWSKDEVKAVLLVKPGIGGFEPVEGVSIGNQWSKGDVVAVALAEPSGSGFSPMDFSTHQYGSTESAPSPNTKVCQSGHWVSSVLSGGEIVKLEDGSIWEVDSVDTVDSSLWLSTDDVIVCDGKLTDTDDHTTVNATRIH